jgi:ribosomal protein S12 methylthiotransferase
VSFLKIADGCDHPCTFCTIHRLRGPFRSRPADDVLREAEYAAGRGVRELVLLAQDSSRYGSDLAGGPDLAALLRRLGGAGVPWLRVLYLHPARITDDLLAAFAEVPAVVPYLDVPLQHASRRLLAAMGRPAWEPEAALALVARIRALVPGAALRTSFIVGFPGETDEDFDRLLGFAAAAAFDHVGVFEFSPEEGTAAAALGGPVSAAAARERREALMLQQQEKLAAQYERMRGETFKVLVDGAGPAGFAVGRTYFQAPEADPVTLVRGAGAADAGGFIRARVAGHEGYELVAELASRERDSGA